MDLLQICRVCLEGDGPLYNIINSPLQEIFEKITNITIETEGRSNVFCLLCFSYLKNIYKLILKAEKTEQYLITLYTTEITRDNIEKVILTKGLCISKTEVTDSNVNIIDNSVKQEDFYQKGIKEENYQYKDKERDEDDDDHFDSKYDTESDDDILLIKIKKEMTQKPQALVPKRVKKEKKVYARKGLTITKEVFVPKEDQMKELADRSRSKQYLNALFQCHLCYKGFLDKITYDNHRKKHDERIGPFECDVCKLRYSNGQQLKSHVKNSHSRRYECQKCQQMYHTAFQAREHEKWHNGFLYVCKICGHESKTSSTHLTHKRKCYPDMKYVCNICGDSFLARFGLKLHKSKAHKFDDVDKTENLDPKIDRTCALCKTMFLTVKVYTRHLLTCKKSHLKYGTNFHCPICKEYVTNKSLRDHLKQRHLDDKQKSSKNVNVNYSCQECKSTFKSGVVLTAHVKSVHLGIKYNKNVVCEHCGKKFRSNAQLKYHQRTHTGEKPYPCSVCGRHFSYKNQVTVHMRRHTGHKPYSCDVCERSFSQKPALNRHMRVHTGAKPYSCMYCSKSFSQSGSMRTHVNQVHLRMPTKNKANSIRNEKAILTE